MLNGQDAGLQLIDQLDLDDRRAGYHLLAATKADLHRRTGRANKAVDAYRQARIRRIPAFVPMGKTHSNSRRCNTPGGSASRVAFVSNPSVIPSRSSASFRMSSNDVAGHRSFNTPFSRARFVGSACAVSRATVIHDEPLRVPTRTLPSPQAATNLLRLSSPRVRRSRMSLMNSVGSSGLRNA